MTDALYTDLYQLTMAQGYFLTNTHKERANFDYFFRTAPFNGAYVIFAGLADVVDALEHFSFSDEDLSFLRKQGFNADFLDYLSTFTFSGNLHACKEGEVVFALEPILRLEGNFVEAQLVESMLLNTLNFQSLIATKASRIAHVCGDRPFYEFGMRRAPGRGSLAAARASLIGGARGTSNVEAAKRDQIPLTGTMAHAWVQNFPDELSAFRAFAKHYPDRSVLLVDTYNTLDSGVPNAITIAKELRQSGHELQGIRLDSGDLAYLSKKAITMLDEAGFPDVQIVVTNQLDEHLIKSLLEQQAPIDAFGVGTRLVTGHDEAALDGVYKLSVSRGVPCLKISDNFTKVNFPGLKTLYRFVNPDTNTFHGDAFALAQDPVPTTIYHPFFPEQRSKTTHLEAHQLLEPILIDGKRQGTLPTAAQAADYARTRLAMLPPEHKRFANPHTYKVGVSRALLDLRSSLYQQLTDER